MTERLVDLAMEYFRRMGFKVESNVSLEGTSGSTHSFDFIVKKESEVHPVWVKDWRRTAGINVVISLDRAASDVGLSEPILISNKFSEHAKSYAKRRKILLLTKKNLIL
ncbi:MAG TPA: hypothetical protein ENF62_00385 [Candidatus Bathyarchaeota archaeon]|nr:hypothetical protein [Candidatus Bathyarchaeota archaeon]